MTRLVKFWAVYSPGQYERAVELWRRLLDCGGVAAYGAHNIFRDSIEDSHLWELVMSDGAETEDVEAITVSLMSYSDHGGSCLDAANVRSLAEMYVWVSTHTNGVHGEGEASVTLGELPRDVDNEVDWQLDQLEGLVKTIEALADYPLIDDEMHSNYVRELASESWGCFFGSQVHSDLADILSNGDVCDMDDFGFPEHEIREMYYGSSNLGGPDDEWVCEGATSVVNYRHDEIVTWMADRMVDAWRIPVVDPAQLPLAV
ncbi:hypothetical protein [Nocardia sp. NPDC051570]|uniref:hypothetical protein n=1 Tax=Nocardia sp. NPDC051570 TaxID=3364324 RepID=UPI0037875358